MRFTLPIPDYWRDAPICPICLEGEGLHKSCLDVASEAVFVALAVIVKVLRCKN